MADDINLSDAVATSAQGPQEIAVAGMGQTREHDLDKLIDAAKFKPNSTIQRRVGGGIRFTKATNPGAL
jgi:hypothetical protein